MALRVAERTGFTPVACAGTAAVILARRIILDCRTFSTE